MKRHLSVLGAAAVFLAAGVGVAFAMGLLNLPGDPVTVTHGPWMGGTLGGSNDIELSDVPDGYDVTNGWYIGWCIEANFQGDAPPLTQHLLVDSTDEPEDFPSPCENYDTIPWNYVNYVLNHRDGSVWDVQLALWQVAGTNHPVHTFPMTQAAQDMVDDALANGQYFVPGPGDIVAVAICSDGIQFPTVGDPPALQDTIIEVLFDGDGCTPGYWKQPQHFDSWPSMYSPTNYFDDVFADDGIPVGPHLTLLQALNRQGGGENAFLRHATAALLNASKTDVIYSFEVNDVISMVQSAYSTGFFESNKNLFQDANENWCPLD